MEIPRFARGALYSVGLMGGLLTGAYFVNELDSMTPPNSGPDPQVIEIAQSDAETVDDLAPILYPVSIVGAGVLGLGLAVAVDRFIEED